MKRLMALLLPILAAMLVLTACSAGKAPSSVTTPEHTILEATPEPTREPTPEPTAVSTPEPDPVEALLGSLTLREKVGQLFVIRLEAVGSPEDDGIIAVDQELEAGLAEYPAGGVILMGKNIRDGAQLSALTAQLHALNRVRLLLCTDEEGGVVARLANTDSLGLVRHPAAGVLGRQGEAAVLAAGKTIGSYLKEYGIDADLAPVADVNSNPQNPVIGTRAFSHLPEEVVQLVSAFLDGLHQAGVMGCIKHFPGHGDTTGDTHSGAVVLDKSWEELLACELIPFQAALAETDLLMTAHISLPQVTGDATPVTLSYTVLTEKLRGEMGYTGVILTDALEMAAITDRYTAGEGAVQALLAGADLLLSPLDYAEAFEAVLAAVEAGRIPETRLDESVLRILRLKARYELLEPER